MAAVVSVPTRESRSECIVILNESVPQEPYGPDGVALTSAAHPRLPWYKRAWAWLHWHAWGRYRFGRDSIETVEINIEPRSTTILNALLNPRECPKCGTRWVNPRFITCPKCTAEGPL